MTFQPEARPVTKPQELNPIWPFFLGTTFGVMAGIAMVPVFTWIHERWNEGPPLNAGPVTLHVGSLLKEDERWEAVEIEHCAWLRHPEGIEIKVPGESCVNEQLYLHVRIDGTDAAEFMTDAERRYLLRRARERMKKCRPVLEEKLLRNNLEKGRQR